MRFCVHCGAERHGAETFCMFCGQPFRSDQPPATPTTSAASATPGPGPTPVETPGRWSTGRWPTGFVAAWVALALVVAGATVGVLVVRAEHAPPTGHRLDAGSGPPPASDPFPDGEPDSPTATDTDEPADATSTDEPTETQTTPTDPNGVVTLSDSAALDPAAPEVLALLSQYFQAVNTHDYQLYQDIHAADAQASLDPDSFRLGFESTEDSDAVVTVIGVQPDGQPTAEVTFTSTQNSVDGPNGDTCDRWDITLFLEPDGDGYLITTPPSTYHASHQPC